MIIKKDFNNIGKNATLISVIDSDSINEVKKILNKLVSDKKS